MSEDEDHAANVPTLREEQLITAGDLNRKIDKDDVIVVDVRDADEIAIVGKVTSKKWLNIPLYKLGDALKMPPSDFKEKYLLEKPTAEGSNFVFHCNHGRRGAKATALADRLGYTKSANLTGGHVAWKAALRASRYIIK